jgi:hypothetical protein
MSDYLYPPFGAGVPKSAILKRCDIGNAQPLHRIEYSDYRDGWDARYCIDCNAWIEPKCGDPSCEFCANRPEHPLPETKRGTTNHPQPQTFPA